MTEWMLNDEQKATVREWAAAGAGLGEIHKRIRDELGVTMTYLDARFLVADLQVSLDKPTDENEAEDADEQDDVDAPAGQLVDEREAPMGDSQTPGGGGVSVQVDTITQPQAMVSGTVSFSDGQSASWSIDQMGRLALDPDQPSYQPSQEDIMAFQKELQQALKSQGF